MIRSYMMSAMSLGFLATVLAGSASAQQRVIPIWPGAAPGSENWTQQETEFQSPEKQTWVRNVVKPTLTVYLPEPSKATGTGIIVCPGGAFLFLAWEHEGTQVAEWLRERGVAAFVLKYRLIDTGVTQADYQKKAAEVFGSGHQLNHGEAPPAMAADIPLAAEDGRQAVRYVREHAAEFGVNPQRIGIMGFSAGGVVTDEVALHHDAASRPDFAAPIYAPVFGEVTAPEDAPPLFIACANDDAISNKASVKLMSAWQAANKPVEVHVYSKGGHGFGMTKKGLPSDHWIDRLGDWLEAQGLLKPPA
jgi:acetyl esterase/lipase